MNMQRREGNCICWSFSVLLFLNRCRGEEDDAHESLELSWLKDESRMPFGVVGFGLFLRFWPPIELDSSISWKHPFTFSYQKKDLLVFKKKKKKRIFSSKSQQKIEKRERERGDYLTHVKNTQKLIFVIERITGLHLMDNMQHCWSSEYRRKITNVSWIYNREEKENPQIKKRTPFYCNLRNRLRWGFSDLNVLTRNDW